MIPSRDIRNVKRYSHIDHGDTVYGWNEPKEGESFVGIPHEYYGDGGQPFIEVWKGGFLIRTVNCADISMIEFFEDGS